MTEKGIWTGEELDRLRAAIDAYDKDERRCATADMWALVWLAVRFLFYAILLGLAGAGLAVGVIGGLR